MFLKDVYVAADHRNQGIGERIMQFLAKICTDQGLGHIDWVVETERTGAFYERLGATLKPHKAVHAPGRKGAHGFGGEVRGSGGIETTMGQTAGHQAFPADGRLAATLEATRPRHLPKTKDYSTGLGVGSTSWPRCRGY